MQLLKFLKTPALIAAFVTLSIGAAAAQSFAKSVSVIRRSARAKRSSGSPKTKECFANTASTSAPQAPQAKRAKPEQFVDLSLLQELEAEKFFDEMARRYK